MTTRIENAIAKLFSAFIKGELRHGDSCECAVGNMCNKNHYWASVIDSSFSMKLSTQALCVIVQTSYTAYEIYEIEKSFEGRIKSLLLFQHYIQPYPAETTLNKYNDTDGFLGLTNAFETLYQLENFETINILEMAEE